MKIALVAPYDSSWPAGVCSHVRGLAGALRELGHRVIVVSPGSAELGAAPGPDVHHFGRAVPVTGNGSTARITFDVSTYRAVSAFLQREAFDVIHVHEPFMPVLPALVLLSSRSVNVATWHTYRDGSPWYRLFQPCLTRLDARIHGRIAVSPAARELVHAYFPAAYEVIPNGIDVAWFREDGPSGPREGDGRPRVLFVGRFTEPRKGFRVLVAALPTILKRVPDVEIVVIGPGDLTRYPDLPMRDRKPVVRFVGHVSDAEMMAWFHSCNLLCSPALGSESFGLVLAEAMACGLPVVASDIPGYRSVLTDGREGVLCTPGNSGELARTVADLLVNRTMRELMGACGKRSALAYSWASLAPRILDVYRHADREMQLHRPASSRAP